MVATKLAAAAVTMGLFGGASAASAAVIYSNDFSGTGGNVAFTTQASAGGSWSVTGGVYSSSPTNPATFGASNVSLASNVIAGVPGASAGNTFAISSNFVVTNKGAATTLTVGFGSFGATATFAGAAVASAYYLADVNIVNGNVRILSLGDTAGFTGTNTGTAGALALNTTYTLKLTGTNVGGTLNLSIGLFDAAGTTQLGTSSTAVDTSPLNGTNFGYRNNASAASGAPGATNVQVDNYTITDGVAVPEPTTVGLLMTSAGLLTARRRTAR